MRDDDVLVLAVAGSSDDRAVRDCRATAGASRRSLGREVRIGFLVGRRSAAVRAVAEARAAHPGARSSPSATCSRPGYFQDLVERPAPMSSPPPLLVADAARAGATRPDRARPLRRGIREPELARANRSRVRDLRRLGSQRKS